MASNVRRLRRRIVALPTGIAILACLCAMVVLFVTGCQRQVGPPLLELSELAPREIEARDRLEVLGSGFPQGRAARVTLEGTVYRPGEAPSRRVTVELEANVATPERLEFVFREDAAERFCGRGDRAAHATFRGDVTVSFRSNNEGAPPLVGVLHGATLDVQPSSARASVLDARVAEGGRLLAFLGVVPSMPGPRGLPVEQVRAGSLAERSGIQVGDLVTSVDGVHVLSLGDLVPASARSAELTIRHGDSGIEETKTVPLFDYSGERVPIEYVPALVVVGLALALLVLLIVPGPASLAAFEMQIASRMRRFTLRALLVALVGTGRHAALSAIGSAIIAAFALTPWVVGREIDGVLLLFCASTLLLWSRLAKERGVLSSLRTAAEVGTAVLAMVAAMALLVGQLGAIELAEIVRAQGGAPWQFAAARHPACALLAVVYGVAVISLLRVRERPLDPMGATDQSAQALGGHAALLERAGVLFAAALGVTAFLGGWQLPGVEARTHGFGLLAASVFALKTWAVTALLFGASRIASSVRPRDVVRVVLKRLLPALVLVAASRRLVPSAAIETAFGAMLVALVTLFVARMVTRVHAALGRPEPHASPFL